MNQLVCRLCLKTVATKRGNTTNLKYHLKHNHPTQFFNLETKTTAGAGEGSSRQLSVTDAFSRQCKYKRDSVKWRTLTDCVTRYIAKEMRPLNMVEKPAFKNMNCQKYELPKKTYISQTAIPSLYNKVKDDILKEIKDNSFYSATTDMWSSSNMTPYMSLTIHYITADWTLQSKCLETRYIPQNHTADVLAEALKSALADWELDERKMACITLWLQYVILAGHGSIALDTTSIWLFPMDWTVTRIAQHVPWDFVGILSTPST